jgi:hypothetical protein
MRRRAWAVLLVVGLSTAGVAQPIGDADVRRGIALVEEGEYDAAILTLDGAVRRLAATKGHSSADLAEAYFHLGVAYLGKGHETSAKARFRDAVQQMREMSPSPEKFPPRVIELFEKAREESRAETPAPAPSTTTAATAAEPPAQKKKGGSKTLLLIGGLAVVGGGAALAAGGGGGGSDNAPDGGGFTTTRNESGAVADNEVSYFRFTASRAGTFEGTLTWQDRNVGLTIGCQEVEPPYTPCPGSFQRTSDTTARFTTPVTQREYLISVSNFSGRSTTEPFTIVLRYP